MHPAGVLTGAIVGHAAATGLAVLAGGTLSRYLSPAAVSRVGGGLFLAFALATAAKALGALPEDGAHATDAGAVHQS